MSYREETEPFAWGWGGVTFIQSVVTECLLCAEPRRKLGLHG